MGISVPAMKKGKSVQLQLIKYFGRNEIQVFPSVLNLAPQIKRAFGRKKGFTLFDA
jgi:hypothetical protein